MRWKGEASGEVEVECGGVAVRWSWEVEERYGSTQVKDQGNIKREWAVLFGPGNFGPGCIGSHKQRVGWYGVLGLFFGWVFVFRNNKDPFGFRFNIPHGLIL